MRPLPPLSMPVLQQVEDAETLAERIFAGCGGQESPNHNKVLRAFSACAIKIFDIEVGYYTSLPDSDPQWPSAIADEVTASLVALLNNPKYVYYRDSVRMETWRVLQQHLEARKTTTTIAQSRKPSKIHPYVGQSVAVSTLRRSLRRIDFNGFQTLNRCHKANPLSHRNGPETVSFGLNTCNSMPESWRYLFGPKA